MTYKYNGTSFDDLFEPLQEGDPQRGPTGYMMNGVDLASRYAAASIGTPQGPVGYRHNGVDIGPTFCMKGAAVRTVIYTMTVGILLDYGIHTIRGYAETGWNISNIGSIAPVTYKGFKITSLTHSAIFKYMRLVVKGDHERDSLFNEFRISGTPEVFIPQNVERLDGGWWDGDFWTAWQWPCYQSDLENAPIGSKRTFYFT